MGCGRDSALEGLSDHLLALRAVLDGHGPVGASLPMRASALIADETFDRIEARERVESALELERALMNGAPSTPGLRELAAWIEEGVRRMLREAALGELGTDLNTAADETLIATGLDGGDAEIAVSGRNLAEPEEIVVPDEIPRRRRTIAVSREIRASRSPPPTTSSRQRRSTTWTRRPASSSRSRPRTRSASPRRHWLDEVDAPEHGTLDFPAIEGDVQHRERIDTPRVRHLFPVPEDADWEVRELKYDHYAPHAAERVRPARRRARSAPRCSRTGSG